LYYGKKYGLTEGIFADKEIDPFWENAVEVPLSSLENDTLKIRLDHLEKDVDYYYRLRVKNDEGITWAFDTDTFNLGILSSTGPAVMNDSHVRIFPNPVEHNLRIETAGNIDIEHVGIMNSAGSRIFSSNCLSSVFSYDMRDLPAGIYFVTVKPRGSKELVTKIIKK